MPELNANIPPIDCYVRGNFLRDQEVSHDKYFPCVIFGVSSIKSRSPLFHFLMEDGGIWWRMPINAFCTKPGVPEEPIYNLVLWNSFSPHISVTKFENLSNMRMSYTDRNKNNVGGKYLFTLDWHNPESNILDDGNLEIQTNNRIRLKEPSFVTKKDLVIQRLINTNKWDVESYDKWVLEDSNVYDYDISESEVDK
jgi:hypothetical protein